MQIDPRAAEFMNVFSAWPEYFKNYHEGLGTTYERFILHGYFRQIADRYQVSSLIEVPSFGMTGISGINSLWWSAAGITPTVLDNDRDRLQKIAAVWQELNLPINLQFYENESVLPFADGQFDLSWNFAALWLAADLDSFLTELSRITSKVIFICVPNNKGIGYRMRAKGLPGRMNGFNLDWIEPQLFIPKLEKLNWQVWKKGYLDIPPWPDIAMKKEDMLRRAGLGFLVREKQPAESGQDSGRLTIVDYFNGTNPDLEKQILRYGFLEKAPWPIPKYWGHHRYFILERV